MKASERNEVIRAGQSVDAFQIEIAAWQFVFKMNGGKPYASFIKGQGRYDGKYLNLAQRIAIDKMMGEKE